MKPSWIVFDIGGVLYNWQASREEVADFLGVTVEKLQEEINPIKEALQLGEFQAEDGWVRILSELGSDKSAEEVLRRWAEPKHLLPDTLKLVGELHQAGYRLAIFSNTWGGLIKRTFGGVPELSNFSQIVASPEAHLRKPEAAMYEYAEKVFNASGDAIYLIDDEERNIAAARERGWQTFRYDLNGDRGQASNEAIRKALL